jgi:hypothetical protein
MTDAVLTEDSVVQFLNRFEEIAEKEDFDLIQSMVHDNAFFRWEGSMDGKSFRVQGRGTRVLVVEDGRLQILHEHLSRFPNPAA